MPDGGPVRHDPPSIIHERNLYLFLSFKVCPFLSDGKFDCFIDGDLGLCFNPR